MSALESALILWEFARARRTLSSMRTREDVRLRQDRMLARQLDRLSRTIPFYREFRGLPLSDWPMMDKASALANFSALNAHGVTAEAAWAAAEKGLRNGNGSGSIGALTVGTSSGTSGNRGLFLISPAERRMWLGSILAHAVPEFPFRSFRIALMLSTNNELYETTNGSSRLAFRYFDLRRGVDAHAEALRDFRPDVLVAPPQALRRAGEIGGLKPSKAFAGGEVMDPLDRAAIREGLGVEPRDVYQATEGFLGVACERGTIHLNEDWVRFDWDPVDPAGLRHSPVITDLRRTSQAMVRYRMNDVLRLAPGPCPCGCARLAVAAVEGRCDDALELPSANGTVRALPDGVRTAVLDADRTIDDFRVVQTGPAEVVVSVPGRCGPETADRAAACLARSLAEAGAVGVTVVGRLGVEVDHSRKLRRVERRLAA